MDSVSNHRDLPISPASKFCKGQKKGYADNLSFLIAPKKAWQHSQSPGFKMHGTRLRHHDSGLLAVPENTVEKRSEHHRVWGKSCALFLEVSLCTKTVSGGFGTPPEDFSALCDLRERRVKSRETAVTTSWKHAFELRKCRPWHPLSPSHIRGQIFFWCKLDTSANWFGAG